MNITFSLTELNYDNNGQIFDKIFRNIIKLRN